MSPRLIGMVHLLPLPGAPRFAGDLDAVVARAVEDAATLEEGGFDALLLENFGDVPFYPERVPPWTVAALTRCAVALRARSSLPIGVNVLRNDARAALAIACAAGLDFIRVNVHGHAAVTDQGLLEGRAHETVRLRAQLAPTVEIAADVRVKHARPLAPGSLTAEARDLTLRGLADVVIVSGEETGQPPRREALDEVRAAVEVPVWIGSGLRPDNLAALLPACSGAIVGSCLHRAGDLAAPIDAGRVRALLEAAGRAG